MAAIRQEVVHTAINKSFALLDYNAQNSVEKQDEFRKQIILADESLTDDEKSEAIKYLSKNLDYIKVVCNQGEKRICENCQDECLAILYCEHCVRNYLKEKFSNWTSGNEDIDNLIQKCHSEAVKPDMTPEWIPYNNLQNIKYLTRGGFSEIYTAEWIDGRYFEWDSKEKRLTREGSHNVVLKKLENFESANRSWIEEGKTHLTLSNKATDILRCYGLTKDPSSENYMLVMSKLDMDLRTFMQQNHYKLTWTAKIGIAFSIVMAIDRIHHENAIHRDLHSGNVLFNQSTQRFHLSDLGFCGPANKPLNSIYGTLPYMAPEVIAGKETTKSSDIYSIGMLMWEISSGQPPFINYEHNYELATKIVNGIRPKIVPGTPTVYKEIMERCWDADITKRPHCTCEIGVELRDLTREYFQDNAQLMTSDQDSDIPIINNLLTNNYSSKVFHFENLPEPRNATEGEKEAFYSKSYDLNISDDIEEFNEKHK